MTNLTLEFPAYLDPKREQINCIAVTQEELMSHVFHDSRLAKGKSISSKRDLSNAQPRNSNAELAFIFHTAFCGSTFLARILANVNAYHSIREPNVLMELANMVRMNQKLSNDGFQVKRWLDTIFSSFLQLEKDKDENFSSQKMLLVKPTNAANNLIPVLLRNFPRSKSVFLYTSREDFLVSIIKKGEQGRNFVRHLYNVLSLDKSIYISQDFRQANSLTDLQIACLVWTHQMSVYQACATPVSGHTICFVEASEFLAEPEEYTQLISTFYGQPISEKIMCSLVNSGVFYRHSKDNNSKYSAQQRLLEKQQVIDKYASELTSNEQWFNSLNIACFNPKEQ